MQDQNLHKNRIEKFGDENEKNYSNLNLKNINLFQVKKFDGMSESFDYKKILLSLSRVVIDFENSISIDLIMSEVVKNLSNNLSADDIQDALILSATSFIEKDPSYSKISARLLLQKLSKEVFQKTINENDRKDAYKSSFIENIEKGVKFETLDPRLLEFDLNFLASKIIIKRDDLFDYLGLRTLYERYFIKIEGSRSELPQSFWMRVAMGVAILEEDKNEKAVEFYNLISLMNFIPSTPTLLHAGTTHPQLSSCYLSTIKDDLFHIFKCYGDNAQMSRWSGGVANDWTYLRSTGAYIKSIKSGSQGVIPFLKIANDVTASINRSGSRRGATVAYLETWHYDIEDFLDLRRNTGDERRRTHDMNTANWIPDLFLQRVENHQNWTLFSTDEVPDLHDLYGESFKLKYEHYEQMAIDGKIKLFKTIKAEDLWKKMLTRLFETGHPWIVFKDACNIRSPQDHIGVVHSSNLCTEITLNTSENETAVCNLGSVNLEKHVENGKIDEEFLQRTIETAVRMLDNVIDINFYPTKEGKYSNSLHRPIGLGLMGYQDAMFKLNINFETDESLKFADYIGELFSYFAIKSSSKLASQRGVYSSYQGSKWSRGIFPLDTIDMLEKERNEKIEVSRDSKLNWNSLKEYVLKNGMRNSNVMAIAPTATISNIAGCFPCIEPIYKNLYVKSNMGGEFTIINKYLIEDLKKISLWSDEMLDLIKYYDGNISNIDIIPDVLKNKYKESFQIDPEHLIECTALRSKWIDQSQSHNVFMSGVSGKKLDSIYKKAWKMGLKGTYYLRTLGASQIEKSTLDAKVFGYTQKREYTKIETENSSIINEITSCNISEDSDCSACQ